MENNKASALAAVDTLLGALRKGATAAAVDPQRLPPWFDATSIRAGWVEDRLALSFEASTTGQDEIRYLGQVLVDSAVFLDHRIDRVRAVGMFGAPPGSTGVAIVTNGGVQMTPDVGVTVAAEGALGQFALFDFRVTLSDLRDHVYAKRVLPLALTIHETRVHDADALLTDFVTAILEQFASGSPGDFYKSQKQDPFVHAQQALVMTKKHGVLVLGAYRPAWALTELRTVADALTTRGYEARLVADLADISAQSNEEKVKFWLGAVRFAVMVDRQPSGHIAEYSYAKEGRVITAVMVPNGGGSSYMISDADLVDINFMKKFPLNLPLSEAIKSPVQWAEKLVSRRASTYDAAYPWRSSTP